MDTRTKIVISLASILGVFSFFPNQGILWAIKLFSFIGLFIFIFRGSLSGSLPKTIQVKVQDVASNRREKYREQLVGAISGVGEVSKDKEQPGEVSILVSTKRPLEDVSNAAERCRLKMQFNDAFCFLTYTSLEATGEMSVTIQGQATPGSTIKIEGVSGSFSVGSNGMYAVQVPYSVVQANRERGYIPAKCSKGKLTDEIQIPIK